MLVAVLNHLRQDLFGDVWKGNDAVGKIACYKNELGRE